MVSPRLLEIMKYSKYQSVHTYLFDYFLHFLYRLYKKSEQRIVSTHARAGKGSNWLQKSNCLQPKDLMLSSADPFSILCVLWLNLPRCDAMSLPGGQYTNRTCGKGPERSVCGSVLVLIILSASRLVHMWVSRNKLWASVASDSVCGRKVKVSFVLCNAAIQFWAFTVHLTSLISVAEG